MQKLELSDIYPVCFLVCTGFKYELKTDISPNGKKRIIFVFDKNIEQAQELIRNFYTGQDDSVSANKYSRVLKELKSLVHNY